MSRGNPQLSRGSGFQRRGVEHSQSLNVDLASDAGVTANSPVGEITRDLHRLLDGDRALPLDHVRQAKRPGRPAAGKKRGPKVAASLNDLHPRRVALEGP